MTSAVQDVDLKVYITHVEDQNCPFYIGIRKYSCLLTNAAFTISHKTTFAIALEISISIGTDRISVAVVAVCSTFVNIC